MTIQPLKNDQAVMSMANKATQAASTEATTQVVDQQKSSQRASTLQKPDTAKSGDAASMLRLQAIQEESATGTTQAKAVRAALTVEQKLGEMKDLLSSIVKQYPPFPLGNEQRVQYLMGISSIREQIEKMTIPPDPAKGEAKLIWSDMFQGIIPPVLEPYGPAEATDVQVGDALSTVRTIQAGLAERSSALEQQITKSSQVTAESASPLSQATGQKLAATQLPLTKQLSELLKSL